MKFKITFVDEVQCESIEDCYDELLKALSSCVFNKDVTPFNFVKLKDKKHEQA